MARRSGMFGGLRHFFCLFSANRSKRGTSSNINVRGYEKLMRESNTPSSSARTSGRRQSSKPLRIIGGKQAPEIRMGVKGACTMLAAPWPASIVPRDIASNPPPMKRSKSRMSIVTLRKVRGSISRFKEATRNSELQLSDLFGGNHMLMQVTATPVTRTSKRSTGKSTSRSTGVCRRPHPPLPAVAASSGSFRQR